nr:CocE/NonD family hydrolase [Streptomyces sp. CC210A]
MRPRVRSSFPYPADRTDVRVPLPDGTLLYARIWRPLTDEPVPALLEYDPGRLTDGTAPRDAQRHPWYAGHGYASVRVDPRGRGNSEGLPHSRTDAGDAAAVVAWLGAQPWCTGRIGMTGLGPGATRPCGRPPCPPRRHRRSRPWSPSARTTDTTRTAGPTVPAAVAGVSPTTGAAAASPRPSPPGPPRSPLPPRPRTRATPGTRGATCGPGGWPRWTRETRRHPRTPGRPSRTTPCASRSWRWPAGTTRAGTPCCACWSTCRATSSGASSARGRAATPTGASRRARRSASSRRRCAGGTTI